MLKKLAKRGPATFMDLIDTNWLAQLGAVIKVAVAMGLGGLVGMEREYAHRPAGFRTHMLVGGAAALLVGLADVLAVQFAHEESVMGHLRVDPIRVVEAVVAGVGFLGAGTIFRARSGERMAGLTTAASLLLVAGIGIAVALEQLLTAVAVTVLALIVLVFLRLGERHKFR